MVDARYYCFAVLCRVLFALCCVILYSIVLFVVFCSCLARFVPWLVTFVRLFCVREVCEVRFPGFVFAFALLCFELACFVGSFWVVLFRIVS